MIVTTISYEKANPREELIPYLNERHFRIPHSEITFVGLFGFCFLFSLYRSA